MKEHSALMDLVPESRATHVAINSGSWFDASTWKNGKIPTNNARVMIAKGVNVLYNGESNARLKTVRLDGTLTFAHNQNTKMVVDTFVETTPGTLNIGTEKNPIQADKTAQIIIANEGKIDKNWDPTQLSRGMITHGKVRIYGAEKTDFIALAQDAQAGDRELVLKGKPTSWAVGDKLVLGGTSYGWNGNDKDNSRFQDEVLTITQISGNRVKFTNDNITQGDNTVLRFDHVRPNIKEKNQLKLYVANTSRNVVFESEDGAATPTQQRGHVMFMHNPDVQVNNAGFYNLGRSDKAKVVDDVGQNVDGTKGSGTNVRGRYALHVHRAGADDLNGQAALLKGNAVVGSPGWGIVHHDSHAIIKDNVVFDVVGTGIAAESGNELGRWENNISIKTTGIGWQKADQQKDTRERKFDFGFRGEGYWLQGSSQVVMKDNVAISANDAGFTIFGDSLDPKNDFRDAETIQVKNLPANVRNRVAKPGQQEIDVTDAPLTPKSGFESYNTTTGMKVWGLMTNFDGHLEFSSPEPKTAHQVRSQISDLTLWGNRWQGLRVSYSSNLDFKDGLIIGDVEKPKGGSGLFHNHATFKTNYNNLNIQGFNQGAEIEFLNEEKDFTQSSIINSKFSNNTYNLTKIGDESSMKGRPDDFPEAFAIKNTVFEDKDGNRAPIASFGVSAAGGLAVNFNGGGSRDSDPLKPDSTSPKYPIDSKGIATYGWDFNNDGRFDAFGRQVTHKFTKAGNYDVTLKVLDNQGAAKTLTKTINVKPTAYPNAFKDSSFSSTGKFLEPWKSNSQWSDDGWFATDEVSRSNGSAVLSKVDDWENFVGQVVENNKVHKGQQTLSFNLKNLEGSDKPWRTNEVTVELWGVNGQFKNNVWEGNGPTQVGTLPMQRSLLSRQEIGGENGQFFNWKKINTDVNLGNGYDFLLFQAKAQRVLDPGDSVAIDNVQLGGAYNGSGPTSPQPKPAPAPKPTPPTQPKETVIGEYDTLQIDDKWRTVSLDNAYDNPVVIVSDPTFNGSDPAIIRIKNVAAKTFQLRIQEPNYKDGQHTKESVSYMVMEAGDWALDNGARISAGTHRSSKLTSKGFDTITLEDFGKTPAVLSQVQTVNGSDWVTTRTQNQSKNGFQLAMQEEEALNKGGHKQETIGWVALNQGVASDGDTLIQGGMTGRSVGSDRKSVQFKEAFDKAPSVIAKLGSFYGADVANVRLDDISNVSFGARVHEEQSLDSELAHTNESIAFLALEGRSGTLTGVGV
ncbi:MAG: G8 domain-containing protein [Cyanobacteria bacterium P01_C01_bin.118]